MQRVRQQNTSAEAALRRELYACGLRYRVQVPVLNKPRRVADVAFSGLRVAVFIDGCFWHGCQQHATWPKANAEFWRSKILAKRDAELAKRDAEVKRLERRYESLLSEHDTLLVRATSLSAEVSVLRADVRHLMGELNRKS